MTYLCQLTQKTYSLIWHITFRGNIILSKVTLYHWFSQRSSSIHTRKIHNMNIKKIQIYFGLWEISVIIILMIITTFSLALLLGLFNINSDPQNNLASRCYFYFIGDLCWEAPPRIRPGYSKQFGVLEQQLQPIQGDRTTVTIY